MSDQLFDSHIIEDLRFTDNLPNLFESFSKGAIGFSKMEEFILSGFEYRDLSSSFVNCAH